MKKIFPFIAIFILLTLPFVYWLSKGADSAIYIQCIGSAAILIFGYYTYNFQRETNEFNRLSKLPAFTVTKNEIEKERVIHINNLNNYAANNVYIGSFLFTSDGYKNVLLYDEIQAQVIKCYPIIQSDILKEDFRDAHSGEDQKRENYGSSLRSRINEFINQNNNVYLVIAIRSPLMEVDETLLFYYKCKYDNQNAHLSEISFISVHLSAKETLYKKSLDTVSKRYTEYRKRIQKKRKRKH